MANRPLINDSIVLLDICGLLTYETNLISKIKKIIFTICLIYSYIDVIVNATVNWNKPGSEENLLICFGFSQLIIKTIVYKSQYLLLTLKKMERFYPLTNDDLKRGVRNGEMFSKIKFYLKSFFLFYMGVLLLFSVKTLVSAEKVLPFGSYVFRSKDFPFFEIGYMYEILLLIFIVPAQVGFDILYISMVTNIVYEFRLLKRDISQLPINENPESDAHTLEVLRDLINHHNVIYDCSRALRRAFYIPFLCIFIFIMVEVGFALMVIISNPSVQNIGINFIYGMGIVYYLMQLFLYCAPGTILILESTEVSDVIFDTDWWIKTQPQLRKAYVSILQRANKPVLLSAGGMMNVTLQSFTSIVKSLISIFTCVKAMYKKA